MNIGDYVRSGICYLDELFVEATGRSFIHIDKGVRLIGVYQLPPKSTAPRLFGLDEPDEMEVELGYKTTKKKLGELPKLVDKFIDFNGDKWVVNDMHRLDGKVKGQNRLVLTVCRYQETVISSPQYGRQGDWVLYKQ